MELNILNIILVSSFGFLSVALGVKWISETIIEYALARQGLQMQKLSAQEFERLTREAAEDDDTFD